jgi:hypothetical protein
VKGRRIKAVLDTIFSVRVSESQPVSIFISVSFLINAIGRLNRRKETNKIHAFHTPISKTGIRSMIKLNPSNYFSITGQLKELKGILEISKFY